MQSPDTQYNLYSVVGHFLGPASTEVITRYHVEDVRTTKSFATRKVEAWQDWTSLPGSSHDKASGTARKVMILLLDFQVPEKASMFEYSISPLYVSPSTSLSNHGDKSRFTASIKSHYSTPEDLPSHSDYIPANYNLKVQAAHRKVFHLFDKWFHIRPVVASMGIQNAMGIAKERKTTQDEEPITRRTNSYWVKIRDIPSSSSSSSSSYPANTLLPDQPNQDMKPDRETKGVHEAALAFWMDAMLAASPLILSSHSVLDAALCSSLDLSTRFLRPPNLSEWIIQEQTTEAGTAGRTFSTGRIWDTQGRLVAVMTQVGIMRPRPHDNVLKVGPSKM